MSGPSADLRARVLAAAAANTAPTRREREVSVARGAAIAIAAMAALAVVLGGVVRGGRSEALIGFTSGMGLVLAVLFTTLATPRSAMLGRPRGVLLVALLATAPLLAIVPLLADALWPGAEPVRASAHAACSALSLVEGAVPLVFFLWLRAGSDPLHPALTGAALGAASGAWAAMLAYLRCPHVDVVHCIVAHGLVPAVMLAAAGALLGRKLLGVRRLG